MAVEPQLTRRWDRLLTNYVSAGFRVARLANIGQGGIQLIQKSVTVATLWLGARLVTEGALSVGQLIAFNMLAGQVAAPVLRLAQLWQDFQQVGISIARLGDILNTHSEIVAIERSRGNPISVADLRAVNGLARGIERKLTLDQPLLVPRRQQDRLLLDIGQVKLDFNPQDGSYQYTIKDPANHATVIHSRSRDPASGVFSDRYAEIDSKTGAVRRETILPVVEMNVEHDHAAFKPSNCRTVLSYVTPMILGSIRYRASGMGWIRLI